MPAPRALSLSRLFLRVLVVANVLYGLGIVVLLVSTLVAEGPVFRALGVKPAEGADRMMRGMRLIAVVGLAGVPIGHLILTRLIAIVDTVRAGDPFIIANAQRLQNIAATLLGIQLLHLVIGFVIARTKSQVQQLDIDWSFSITPWLVVLLLFVLARVFEHGARMRADLEGTV